MEIKFTNYNYNDNIIDLEILNHTITGLTGNSKREYFKLLSLINLGKGQLLINDEKVTKENIHEYKNKISIIKNELENIHFITTVKESVDRRDTVVVNVASPAKYRSVVFKIGSKTSV